MVLLVISLLLIIGYPSLNLISTLVIKMLKILYYYYYIPHHEQVYTQKNDYMKLKRRGNTYNTVQTTAIKTRNI